MKSFLRNSYFIILLSVLVKSVVIAQVNSYPVNGIVKVALPASISFEDYVNPITSPIDLVISMNDQRFPVRSVFLSLRMEGPAGTIASFANRVSYQLIAGNNFIPKAVVASCFSPDNFSNIPPAYLDKAMPAGIYTFSFRVTDALTGAVLSLPISSAPVWIEASDPPVPVQPANYSGVPATQVQNVIFQWLPRHTPTPNIEYEFTLTELPIANRGNLQNVFLSQPPLFKTTVPIPTLLYDAKYPPLRQGAVYAWRVQAKPKFGIAPGKTSTFLNEGYSEIFSFLYEKPTAKLNPPTDLQVAYTIDYDKLKLDWKGEDNHLKYEVSIGPNVDRYDSEMVKTEDGGTYFKQGKLNGKEKYEPLYVIEVEKGTDNLTKYVQKYYRESELRHDVKVLVKAIDVFGRVSEPAIYDLKSPVEDIFNDDFYKPLTLQGKIEVSVPTFDPTTLKVAGEKGRLLPKNITVCLCSTNLDELPDDVTKILNNQTSQMRVKCVGAEEDGSYSIGDIYMRTDVTNFKHTYLLVKSRNQEQSDMIMPIQIGEEQGGRLLKTLPKQTLIARMTTLIPNFKFADGSKLPNNSFEQFNIFRLKSVYEDPEHNTFLKIEAGSYTTREITYNKNQYVQVADLKVSNDLFDNSITNDHFVLGAKEFNKDEKFFSLPRIVSLSKNRVFVIKGDKVLMTSNSGNVLRFPINEFSTYPEEVSINYQLPTVRIYGKVQVRGKSGGQALAIPNWEVGFMVAQKGKDNRQIAVEKKMLAPEQYEKIHWEKVTTDENGYYEFALPDDIYLDQNVSDIIIYNRIPGVYTYFNAARLAKPFANIEYNIALPSFGSAIASVIKDQNGKPVIGAKLTHSSGAWTTTNEYGEFVLNVQFNPALEADPHVKLQADGYVTSDLDLSTFQKTVDSSAVTDFGRSFWTNQIAELKELTKKEFDELGNEDAFNDNFKNYKTQLQVFYKKDSIPAITIENIVKVRTYVTDKNNTKQYVSTTILFGEEEVNIPEEGLVKMLHTTGTSLEGKIINKDKTAEVVYVQENFTVNFDAPPHKNDLVEVEVELKEAVLVSGIVKGFDIDSTDIGVQEGVTISVEGIEDVETDEEGKFEIWLEKDTEEVELQLSKKGFNKISWSFTTKIKTKAELLKDFVNAKDGEEAEFTTIEFLKDLSLSIYQRDATVPDFKTLQGFKIEIGNATSIDGKTFLISGTIDVSEEEGIYTLAEGEELTFEDLEVEEDEFDEENAVLMDDDADLVQETLNLTLFEYAKVESNNEYEEYPNNIKLVKLKLDGRESYGKIGGVGLKFVPEKLMKKDVDPIFQEFNLVPKEEEELESVGFNSDITAKNQAKLDKEAEAAKKVIGNKVAAKAAAKKAAAKAAAKSSTNKKVDSKNTKATTKTSTKTAASQSSAKKQTTAPKSSKTSTKTATTQSSAKKQTAATKSSKTDTKKPAAKTSTNKKEGVEDKKEGEGDKKEGEEEKEGEGEEEEKSAGTESEEPIIPVFVSGGKVLANFNEDLEFKMEYPEDVDGLERRDEKDDKGKPTGKKEKINLGLGLGFGLLLDEEKEPTLSKDGVEFTGNLSFPMMKKIGIEGKMPVVERLLLAPKKDLPMREFRLAKPAPPDSVKDAKPYYVRLGVDKSWRFEVDKIQFYDDFSGAGFGGKLYTDQTNHLIVHSMAIREANGEKYPFLDMEFPEKGFKISKIVLKSPEDQHILLGHNYEDDAYEVEAGVRIETASNNNFAKTIFPLEVEKFVYNTAGKFFISIKVGRTINLGPCQITVRKVMFNKGGGASWNEMLKMLEQNSEEKVKFNETQKFNNKNYRTITSEVAANRRRGVAENVMPEEEEDIELESAEVGWAIGFAGGVQFALSKGMKTKADASFVFGELGGEFKFEMNTIELLIESTAFKGYFSLKIANNDERVGFEGKGELETAKMNLAAYLKYYKVPGGIELGAAFSMSTNLPMGPVMMTTIGGGFNINTATHKYSVFFTGAGYPTKSRPELTEFRAMKFEVLFDLGECIIPIISGGMEIWLKKEKTCTVRFELDICGGTFLAQGECSKKLEGVDGEAELIGTVYLNVNSGSFFIGANVKVSVMGLKANGFLVLGINQDLVGADIPREVTYYKQFIKDEWLRDGKTLNGVLLGVTSDFRFKSSLNLFLFEYSFKMAFEQEIEFFISFSELKVHFKLDTKLDLEAYVRVGIDVFSVTAYGSVKARALLSGGYNEKEGLYFEGRLGFSLGLAAGIGCFTDNALKRGCNSFGLEWFGPVPCGLNFKGCLNGGLGIKYKKGFSFDF